MNSAFAKPRCAYAHNLLDNSDFRNPVNQRGQSSYTTAWGYTLDRWYLGDNRGAGEEAQTLELVPGVGVRISGNHPAIIQRIPLLDDEKMYTCACLCDGTLRFWTFQGSAANTHDHGFAQITLIARPATLAWAALYEGEFTADTLPPYVPKGYAAELVECQRYYVDLGLYNVVSLNQWTLYYGTVTFPLQMRATPTVTLKNPSTKAAGTIGRWDNSGSFVDFTGFLIASATNRSFVVSSNGQFGANVVYSFLATASADL